MVTQIQISDGTWKMLKDMKLRPSQTFDDIIEECIMAHRILKQKELMMEDKQ